MRIHNTEKWRPFMEGLARVSLTFVLFMALALAFAALGEANETALEEITQALLLVEYGRGSLYFWDPFVLIVVIWAFAPICTGIAGLVTTAGEDQER